MNKQRTLAVMACMAMVFLAACSSNASTDNGASTTGPGGGNYAYGSQQMGRRGGVFGQITAVTGNSLIVLGRNNQTYTVDASNAAVMINNQSSAVSALHVGDQIMVRGNPSSQDPTQIVAMMIREGGGGGGGRRFGTQQTQQTQQSQQSH